MAEIILDNLSKTYAHGVRAVSQIDLRIAPGELLALVGPSGCGKTTTLRLIAGLEQPTSGTIRIDGQDATHLPPHLRHVAMVFQRPALYPHLTVRDNLGFALKLQHVPRGERQRRVGEVAHLLNLEAELERHPAQLSGGQQQRVALGRALVRQPRILLLDEPLSNLDTRLRLDLRRELKVLHHRLPMTWVHVTHDPVEAMSLGDRLAVLNAGRLEQVGSPAEVYEHPANRFVAGFLGWPAMSFLEGRLVQAMGQLSFTTGDWNVPIPQSKTQHWQPFCGQALTLGIRPQDVILARDASTQSVEVEVDLVESWERSLLVTLRGNAVRLTALVQKDCQFLNGLATMGDKQKLRVTLMLEHSYLFDGKTGLALGGDPAG